MPKPAFVERKPLYLLGNNECKFPVFEDRKIVGRYLFCAAATRPGEPWCPAHHERCLTPVRRNHG